MDRLEAMPRNGPAQRDAGRSRRAGPGRVSAVRRDDGAGPQRGGDGIRGSGAGGERECGEDPAGYRGRSGWRTGSRSEGASVPSRTLTRGRRTVTSRAHVQCRQPGTGLTATAAPTAGRSANSRSIEVKGETLSSSEEVYVHRFTNRSRHRSILRRRHQWIARNGPQVRTPSHGEVSSPADSVEAGLLSQERCQPDLGTLLCNP